MAGTVLTNKGLALITKLMAAQATLSFSRVAVGTGRVPSGYDAQNMTGLNEYKMDATIESCGVSTEQSDVAYIVTQISSVGVSTGFAITEAGVFATDPDDGEILYAYLDLTQDPQYIYASTDAISKFAEITFNVLVGSVTSVTAIVSPGALVKKSEFDNLKTRVEDVETPEFDASGTAESITDKTSLLASFVTKMPLVKFMRNVVAGFKLVLYSGQIVNNCVTDRPDLPGSAAQLKVLMDLYTVLNTKKAEKQWEYIGNSFNDVTFAPNKYSEIYVCAFIDDDNSKMIPFLLPLETIKHGPDNSITNPRFAGASLYNGWALLHYNDGLIRMQSSSAGSTSIYVYGR